MGKATRDRAFTPYCRLETGFGRPFFFPAGFSLRVSGDALFDFVAGALARRLLAGMAYFQRMARADSRMNPPEDVRSKGTGSLGAQGSLSLWGTPS